MIKHCFEKWHQALLLLVCTIFSMSSLAQTSEYRTDKWRFSDPKPMGFTIMDIQFYDNNRGVAVGANGAIAWTSNGGAKWNYGPFTFTAPSGLKTTGTFADVHFGNATTVYAVGSNGMMAKSTDAGQTWGFVNTPLYANSKNINTVWFLNKDTGYIAGQFNTPDSLPKIYFTRNGGSTWDSIGAPASNGKSRVGYINNVNLPSVLFDVDAKAKEIYRIMFINDSTGYVCGSGSPLFPRVGFSANSSTCLPTTGNLTTSAHSAALLWKISKGNVVTDYSLSKERLGYTGINTNTVTCTTSYNGAGVTPSQQTYKAMTIINDSTVVMMSFNNNTVVKVNTGKNDSTANVNNPGTFEKGKYTILNFPFPPSGGPNAGPPIPPVQVLLASNPYNIKKAANGKLYAPANFGAMWTSVDTGRNWVREASLPQGRNYSSFATWAMDILPSGKVVTAGQAGVVADSASGGQFNSNYVLNTSTGNRVDFVDCNNGIVTGGSQIAYTSNGGQTWVNKDRPDFAASFYNINGFHFNTLNKCYFAVSNGTLYQSVDQGTTLDPLYSDFTFQMNDIKGFGTDTVYGLGYSAFSVPAASRKSSFFRSTNAGATWSTVDIVASTATPAFTAPTLSKMAFPSRNVGYACGTRNGVYKTIDGGLTWTKINPFPALNENVGGAYTSYTSICALDDNTIFVLGNIFTTAGFKRLYKSTDGGTTWTDISNNINTLLPVGNMLYVLFSDVNNGYVCGSNVLFTTNNGGATWTMDAAPEGNLHNAMGFAPRTVPAAIPFANRKLFIGTLSFGSGVATIMEYGDTLNVNVNSSEVVTNATCTNPNGGSITVNATGAIAPYKYSINGGAFQSSNTFTGLSQGPQTLTITDAFCGTLTKTINVGFTDNLTLTTSNDTTVCSGAPVPLVATSAATTYSWSPAAGLSNAAISNPTATVTAQTTYTVTASLNGCVRTKPVKIAILPNPIVNAGQDVTIVSGDVIALNGSSPTSNVQSILWSPATSVVSGVNTFTPTVKPATTTTYTMTVKDRNGCTSTDDAIVTVIPYCIKIMDAFTPNGDGINDKWIVTSGGACTTQVMAQVFNRYGDLVYSNENYQNDWNGTYKGKTLPDGTYYYVIRFKLINGSGLQLKGDVTILR
ncbi:MAG: gliding motility-associated C-terminal domain-containing protein [Bacteroidetes bacterium]|nr:gliding motility-associated C-terminal domain-containing protein [Bacteroidota bacterium]